ncbi:MAG: TlpA disulfide reductase family protein [Pseudomonadota bacterium]
MRHFLRSFLVSVMVVFGASAPACAEDEPPFSSRLVTVGSELPPSAEDTRDDGILRDSTGRPVLHDLLGERLPDMQATRVGGDGFTTSDLAGRWTILAVWGVWCHDSRNDMDNIADLAGRTEHMDDLDFLSVHVPYSADHLDSMYRQHGSVDRFFEARGVSFPAVLDETAELRAALKIEWTPTYLLVGPDLTVHGYRTDFSKGGDSAVETFLEDTQKLRTGS